jgi:DNA-directed RNA polymerase specialized sigma24 family protein
MAKHTTRSEIVRSRSSRTTTMSAGFPSRSSEARGKAQVSAGRDAVRISTSPTSVRSSRASRSTPAHVREDLVQEVLIQAHRSRTSPPGARTLPGSLPAPPCPARRERANMAVNELAFANAVVALPARRSPRSRGEGRCRGRRSSRSCENTSSSFAVPCGAWEPAEATSTSWCRRSSWPSIAACRPSIPKGPHARKAPCAAGCPASARDRRRTCAAARLAAKRTSATTPSSKGPHARKAPCAQRAHLESLLAELAPEQRAVLVSHALDATPMCDVARVQRIPVNTAWNRLRLAREDIRTRWHRHRRRKAG